MPKAMHERLEKQARKKGLKGKKKKAYVFGTMKKQEAPMMSGKKMHVM